MTATAYGPGTPQVVTLVERIGRLTPDEFVELAVVWNDIWVASQDGWAAWDAAWGAARVAGGAARGNAWAAWRAAWSAFQNALGMVPSEATRAAGDAALALANRHLVGQHGFTQAHYGTLTGPWAQVIGPAHPNDPVLIEHGEIP